ncbi:39S ribosomal protein L20, mitochondrial [Plecturocebus cupreus]
MAAGGLCVVEDSGRGSAGTMVFLTAQLWLRNRVTDRYWRIQEVLKHAKVSAARPPCLGTGRPGCPAGRGRPAWAPLTTLVSHFLTQHFRGGRIAATGWRSEP